MRAAPSLVFTTIVLSVLPALAGVTASEASKVGRLSVSSSACGTTTHSDSLYLLEFLTQVAKDTAMSPIRGDADVPMSDTVRFWGTSAQCDTAAVRYRNHINRINGDSLMPLRPMILVRVAPNRVVGYPKVIMGEGTMEFATFDSLLTLVKVWSTS